MQESQIYDSGGQTCVGPHPGTGAFLEDAGRGSLMGCLFRPAGFWALQMGNKWPGHRAWNFARGKEVTGNDSPLPKSTLENPNRRGTRLWQNATGSPGVARGGIQCATCLALDGRLGKTKPQFVQRLVRHPGPSAHTD